MEEFPATFSHPPPVRTSSGPVVKIVGFDTSPASVLRRFHDDAQTPSPTVKAQVSPLGRALQGSQERAPPRLTINTKRDTKQLKLKKSKSYADIRQPVVRTQPIPAAPTTQPNSPAQSSHSQGSSGPLWIPEMSRPRTCADQDLAVEPSELIQTPLISAASSLTSQHRAFSPGHRSFSTRDLFEAQADAVTAQAQVQGLHSALKREHEEVVRLREQLSLVTAERDRLLAELREVASTPRVFDMDDSLMATPFSTLKLR